MSPPREDPSIGHFHRNWRDYEGSFGKKLALSLKNNTRKITRLKPCCGHHGEPGC